MLIRWLLFFTMSVYFLLDYFHSVALISVGYEEANPLVLYLIGDNQNWERLLFLKIGLIIVLGIFLLVDQIQKRGKYEKSIRSSYTGGR